MNQSPTKLVTATLDAFVPSGQTIGQLEDGRKVFVWGGLPGEEVRLHLTKQKKSFVHGIVEEVITPAKDRQEPRDEAFLSTSPWQIVPWDMENTAKQALLQESFAQEDLDVKPTWTAGKQQWHYRNKMEFSFWWDHTTGLELAFHKRGTKTKQVVQGSALAQTVINEQAVALKNRLAALGVEAKQLKTMIVRATQRGEVTAVIFVKDKRIRHPHSLLGDLAGLRIYYSNPKSPASVATSLIAEYGNCELTDRIAYKDFAYSPESFFQVNVEVFKLALEAIKAGLPAEPGHVIDLYSGVGSIGLSVGAQTLVELDTVSAQFASKNAAGTTDVVQAASEHALEYIEHAQTLVVDPPRAGLHSKVISKILEVKPRHLIYLSCNPSTQARDAAMLKGVYTINQLHGFNFFPKTPHIESLAIFSKD